MNHDALEVQGLKYTYPDGFEAVKNISFKIRQGETVGIIGANGAGKSTLLSLLLGILDPDSGRILAAGTEVNRNNLQQIRRKLGLVFQDPDDQLFMPTVFDDVAFGPRNFRFKPEEVAQRVTEALEQVGIAHLKDRAPFKLSGGEKKAAAMASVLAMSPEVMIMDEPTSALDPKARRKVIALLGSLRCTKIITSHDLDMVLETCSRTIVIREGQVAADGKTGDVLTDAALLDRCGLELPLSLQKIHPIC